MIKPEYFLEKYGVVFDETDTAEEKLRQMTAAFGVHESYEGDKPYIFISYAHMDSALVLPAVKAIQDKGYPVWYDAGIRPGSEWAADIAQHLKNASLVLAFVSKSAFDSPNCRAEIVYAFGHRKPMLTVRLDKTPLPDGLDMQLSLSQMFDAFAYDDGNEFVTRLAAAPIIAERISPVLLELWKEKRRQTEEAEQKRREAEEAEKRKQAEEAQRQRLAAEEAERKRREEEEAERKYQQAKEAARIRREAEEAQQKQWETERQEKEAAKRQRAEAQKEREETKKAQAEANRRKKEETEQEKLKNAEREKQKRIMESKYRTVQAGLDKKKMGYYSGAIGLFNKELTKCAAPGLSLESELANYRNKLCQTIYQDACQMEKNRKSRLEAAVLFGALPAQYSDADRRKRAIISKYERTDWIISVVFTLLHLALNVCLALTVNHLGWPWYFGALIQLLPPQVLFSVMMLLRKGFYIKVENTYFVVFLSFILTLIVDAFLFQFVDNIWLRILCSLVVNGLGVAGSLLWNTLVTEWTLPKIK